MRLSRLRIPNYRNLQSFEIDFDESQSTTVLLGRNGSGKSNLIEAIVEIFRDLETGTVPSFAFEIEYVCRGRAVQIQADPRRSTKRLSILIDQQAMTQSEFQKQKDTLLPNHVFAYYSGWSRRLERHFEAPTRRHYESVLNAESGHMPLRRLFFCRKEYSQLVLLAFFMAESSAVSEVLERYLKIERFESALFVLKRPWWGTTTGARKNQTQDGDQRFWHARGAFRDFLGTLWVNALAPIRNNEAIERDIRRQSETTERLYLFIKNEEALSRLKGTNGTSKDLFGYLESLFLADLIDEVRVSVTRTDGSKVKFTQMSEGEQQLLTVLGLLLFTQDDESLYLLDEPDTHLNPLWTYDFLKLLQDNIRAEKGQLIVATHNPLMIGSLRRNQVRILSSSGPGISAVEPEYDPIGIGVEGLLKSEFYGMRSSLAPELLAKIDRHYELLGIETRSDSETAELMGLAVELNDFGFSRSHPNPYFEAFANAFARRVPHEKSFPSKADIDRQSKLADEVLEDVIAAEERLGSQEASGS
jgi:predicted ATPase